MLSEEYPSKLVKMGVKNRFGESGKATVLMEKFEIDSTAIVKQVEELMEK